ncbi:MAG: hypothetical protein NVS4B9_24750 [Ktedonobacteraceae bacterium]
MRDLGITIGRMPTGPLNAITDIPGTLVGHETLLADEPYVARTGVTMIVPRAGDIWTDHAPAGFFSFNGCGEMTGLAWVQESGVLHTPIGITNTNAVGIVRDAIADAPLSDMEAEILLHYLKGGSYAETARSIGRSTKAVDNAMQRARKKTEAAIREAVSAHLVATREADEA